MTCTCPGRITDPQRHDEWHGAVAPLTRADAAELQALNGRPSIPEWTYVDDQFAAARDSAPLSDNPALRRKVPTVASVTSLVVADPMHDRDIAAIDEAIETDAAKHGGQVDPNRVRLMLPDYVQAQVIGARYNTLIRAGRLKQRGWTTNEDRKGRNVGKPIAVYDYIAEAS